MKLNKRLLALSEMVTESYSVVWDCCCDHGLLGIKILSDGVIKQVNFVDVVPEIIQHLTDRLTQYAHHLPADAKWQTLCDDVVNIPLNKHAQTGKRQLVILSGVGGELIISMLSDLIKRYDGEAIDYLLCPVQHTYKLRDRLISLGFKLKQQQLLIENKRGYELLLINQQQGKAITLTGENMWLPISAHRDYLAKLIAHYQRVVETGHLERAIEASALRDYRALYQQRY